jgi:hypothetical protein
MRRLAVIACSLGMLGTLIVGHAPAAQSKDSLEFAVVAIDAIVGGDPVRSSGVVIDADKGLVLTTAHSVWGATSLRLTTGVGVLHGRTVARAPCSDVALVEVQPRIPGLATLDGGGTITHPLNVVVRPADGSLEHRHRPLSADASGAPIVDADGRVSGIADTARGRHSRVIRWSLIDERLGELKPGPRRIYVGWRDEYRCTPALDAFAEARHPGFRARDAVLNAPVPASRVPGTEELNR